MSVRRWFQIHLSTAVILMFVAAGLLWANVRLREYKDVFPDQGIDTSMASNFSLDDLERTIESHGVDQRKVFVWLCGHRGWPVTWSRKLAFSNSKDSPAAPLFIHYTVENVVLYFNIFVALAILIAVAFVCEYLIRRKRRTSNETGR